MQKIKKVDWDEYKFHPSSIKNILAQPQKKEDKLAGKLGETTATYLNQIYIEEVFGRKSLDAVNNFTRKGTEVESRSISLLCSVTGETYFKNETTLENDYVTGTPDIAKMKDGKCVKLRDIKSSWDIWTFMKVTEKAARSSYYDQLLCYMWLLDIDEAELDYCLVDTPDEIADYLVHRQGYLQPEIINDEVAEQKVKNCFKFEHDIPAELRVKTFHFERDDEKISKYQAQIIKCRDYLKTLSLNGIRE